MPGFASKRRLVTRTTTTPSSATWRSTVTTVPLLWALSLSLFFHSLSALLYSLVPLSPSLPLHLSSLSLSSYAVSLWGGCRKSGRKEQWKAGLKLIALPVACLVTKMCVWIGGSKLFVQRLFFPLLPPTSSPPLSLSFRATILTCPPDQTTREPDSLLTSQTLSRRVRLRSMRSPSSGPLTSCYHRYIHILEMRTRIFCLAPASQQARLILTLKWCLSFRV